MGKTRETIDELGQSVGKQTNEVVADEGSGCTALTGVRHMFHLHGGMPLLFLVLEEAKLIPAGPSLLQVTPLQLPLSPTATLLSDVFVGQFDFGAVHVQPKMLS